MRTAAVLLIAWALAAPAAGARIPGRGLCATLADDGPVVAVLSAFPAELAPLVAAAAVERTVEAGGRRWHEGRLDGVRVVLGLTGIGVVNAARAGAEVLRAFRPVAIVMSGVAGSLHRIGDVVVAEEWVEEATGRVFPANPVLLQLAQRAAGALPAPLVTCTLVPPTSSEAETVCLPYAPAVFLGDRGQSGDTSAGVALPCVPGGGEVLGCELPAPRARPIPIVEAQDMESAAVAAVAARRRVPFVAVRAVSDGAGDPRGDRPFPAQFFDYYRLAAENAALVTRALLGEAARLPSTRGVCRLLAQRRWRRAAARLGAPGAARAVRGAP
jgi:adenosylhomocysteine nucleosidase